MSSKRLGDYIQLVDNRSKDLRVTNLLGVSIQKKFIPSITNITNTDMSVYRIIKKNQLAFSPVTSRNGEKITIALLKEEDEAILSPAYQVFEAKDENQVLPEYLFIRTEFDRYARFNSWGSARETFDWADMCEVKLPIPSIEKQEAIVTIYHTLETRKRINEQLKESIKPLCPVLMKGVVESMEVETVEN